MGKMEEKKAKDFQKMCRKCIKTISKEFNMKTISSVSTRRRKTFSSTPLSM